ncbi:uncharacterized protein LOC107021424 [Solanum pennellii]|uniref:Uncharacterized protein LOC107021424 n=1 Tax=Solanum pennellii TaxID=28526 RepID=A0ABM1GY26_SOLPN|nr:uncharacterized protein LOC107021424 [Solanum pennellii]
MVASYKHAIMVKEVTWEKPQQPFLKLNTDGSALHNPGKIGGGGIVRDYQGNMIYAYTIPLGIGTNNQAEIQAKNTLGSGFRIGHSLAFESNQLPMEPTAIHPGNPQNSASVGKIQITHVYREANNTADRLSIYSHNTDIVQHFYIKDQLPTLARGSFILEKLGMANFRRKKLKRIKKPP